MATWKKVVVSGSSAELSVLTLDTALTASSGGTGLTTAQISGQGGKVLTVNGAGTAFELNDASSGDVQAIITPSNSGLSITDTSGINGNVAITMSISSLSTETTLAAADTFAFNDASATSTVTAKKVTLNILSGSIISGIDGDVSVNVGGVSTIGADKVTLAKIADAATGSILNTITGDVTVATTGVSAIGANKVTTGKLATSLGAVGTNQFSGSFKGNGSDLTNIVATPNIDSLNAGTVIAGADNFIYSDDGTEKKVTVALITSSAFASISGDVTVTGAGVATIGANTVDGDKLTDDITIARDLIVDRNLVVAGTASFTNAENLAVADKYILLNSGSSVGDDSGGIVIQGPNQDIGQLFGFQSGSVKRWGVDSNFDADTAGGFTSEAFMSAVIPAEASNTQATITAINTKYNKTGNIYTSTAAGNDIWIYS